MQNKKICCKLVKGLLIDNYEVVMKKLIFTLILLVTFTTLVFAQGKTFTKYAGGSAKDIGFAKTIYEMGEKNGVKAVEVDETLMTVHVTEKLYRGLFYDKISGNRLMRTWQKLLSQNYEKGNNLGTVWLCVEGQKVAECTTEGFWGTEVVVEWFDD